MIILNGTLMVPVADRALVESLMPDHIAATRAEPGCRLCQVLADRCDAGRYLVAERFVSRAAFEAHQTRVHRSDWGRATAHLARHDQVTGTDG